MRILATALLVALGIGSIACDTSDGPTAPTPPAPGAPIHYTAVGASDVIGFGSSAPCLPFDPCPAGKGYVFVAAARLREEGYPVTVASRGLPTAVISPRFKALGEQHGHFVAATFISDELPFVPRESTVITVFAGGNDVNVITAALGGGAGGTNPQAFIDQQVQNFAADLRTLVDGLRDRAPSARIVVLNLPNLARMPYVARSTSEHRQAVHRAAFGMTTTAINPLASQGVRIVDLMCAAQIYQPSSLSADGFHPNDAGYALIAAEVVRAITAEAFPAPPGSCPQMSPVP